MRVGCRFRTNPVPHGDETLRLVFPPRVRQGSSLALQEDSVIAWDATLRLNKFFREGKREVVNNQKGGGGERGGQTKRRRGACGKYGKMLELRLRPSSSSDDVLPVVGLKGRAQGTAMTLRRSTEGVSVSPETTGHQRMKSSPNKAMEQACSTAISRQTLREPPAQQLQGSSNCIKGDNNFQGQNWVKGAHDHSLTHSCRWRLHKEREN